MTDFRDLNAAVFELERARGLGARGFFLYTDQGRPPGGCSLGHPSWDRVWSAATSLGMIPVIHVGNTSRDYRGWADIGWQLPESSGIQGLVRLANTKVDQAAGEILNALLYGGVFHRHPDLSVLIEETHAGWLPWFVKSADRAARTNPVLGEQSVGTRHLSELVSAHSAQVHRQLALALALTGALILNEPARVWELPAPDYD